MDTQTLIVAVIVAAALAWVARGAWRTLFPKRGECGCGTGKGCEKMNDALRNARR